MKQRNLSLLDSFFNKSHGMVQLAMHVSNKSDIPSIVDKLQKIVLGLNLRTTENSFIYEKTNNEAVKIPRFNTMESACRFMYENHTPNYSKSLAKIGFNDDLVVLNIAHLCADGGYFINLVDTLSHPEKPIKEFEKIPVNIEKSFKTQIQNDEYEESPYIFTDPNITRIKAETPKQAASKYAKHVQMQIPVQELSIYNKENKTVKGLTEALWTSYALSANAFNGTLGTCGMATCIDMRKYLKKEEKGWNVCNFYSSVSPSVKLTDGNITVEELGKQMRKDFNDRMKHGQHFTFFKSLIPPDGKKIPGVGIELSSLGQFKVNEVIDDIFVKSSVYDKKCDPLVSFSCFSVNGNGKNTINGMFRYKSSAIDEKTVTKIVKGTEMSLKHLPKNIKVEEALSIIQKYQRNI